MHFWLNLFSQASWREFVRFGSKASGFSPNKWSTTEKVAVGDQLLCYMIGGRGFFGITEVTDRPFYDANTLWAGFEFASWIPVKITLLLPNERGVYPPTLKELSWIKDKPTRYWQGRVAGSPARIDESDAEIIIAALRERL